MPKIVLASGLARWLPAGAGEQAIEVDATRLDTALEQAFTRYPPLRSYVVDEHGRVRQHVAVFVDAVAIADKSALGVALRDDAEIYILQALSGG